MMFAGIPLPSSLHYLGLFDSATRHFSLVDGAADALQLSIDTFEQVLKLSGIRPAQFGRSFYDGLFAALGAVSAIHPHTNCPHCARGFITQYDTLPADDAEVTPLNLFEWFMRNHSESKQVIVDKLRRDFNVLPRKKPGPEGI